jgi:hypothetical protein
VDSRKVLLRLHIGYGWEEWDILELSVKYSKESTKIHFCSKLGIK